MKLQITEVDADGNPVTDLGLAEPISELPHPPPAAEMPTKPKPRPTLDVAIENHSHLAPRIESLCLRLESWDLRSRVAEASARFRAAVASLRESFDALGFELDQLKASDFIAKSTPKTRMLARLKTGAHVRIKSAEMEAEYRQLYSDEELAALEVVRLVGSRVLLRSGQREVGLVEARHLALGAEPEAAHA